MAGGAVSLVRIKHEQPGAVEQRVRCSDPMSAFAGGKNVCDLTPNMRIEFCGSIYGSDQQPRVPAINVAGTFGPCGERVP